MWDLDTLKRMNAETEDTEDVNLELELYQAKHIVHMCQRDPDGFGKNLYRALCNITWKHVKSGQTYSCSWRYAGGVVSTLSYGIDDHMMFYCSGNEGTVTDDVLTELDKLGWLPTEDTDDDEKKGSSP